MQDSDWNVVNKIPVEHADSTNAEAELSYVLHEQDQSSLKIQKMH